MSKYKTLVAKNHCYFVTTSLVNRNFQFLNLDDFARIIVNSLSFLRKTQRMHLFAFVIMPNHLHVLIKPRDQYTVSQIMHSFKRFTSGNIKKILREKRLNIWKEIQNFGGALWQEGFLDINIYSERLMMEKLEYIHNNPVNKKWQLVSHRTEYK